MSRLSQLHLAIMSTYATIDQEPKVKDIDESRALLVQHLRDLVAVFGAEMRRIMGAKAPAPVASLLPAPETPATAESHAAAESTFAQPDRWYPDDGQWVECQELTGAIPDELAYDSVIQVLFASERWSKRAGVNLTYTGLVSWGPTPVHSSVVAYKRVPFHAVDLWVPDDRPWIAVCRNSMSRPLELTADDKISILTLAEAKARTYIQTPWGAAGEYPWDMDLHDGFRIVAYLREDRA